MPIGAPDRFPFCDTGMAFAGVAVDAVRACPCCCCGACDVEEEAAPDEVAAGLGVAAPEDAWEVEDAPAAAAAAKEVAAGFDLAAAAA